MRPRRIARRAGCTKESMDKFMHSAKHVLSAKQYAELKSQCARMQPSQEKSEELVPCITCSYSSRSFFSRLVRRRAYT